MATPEKEDLTQTTDEPDSSMDDRGNISQRPSENKKPKMPITIPKPSLGFLRKLPQVYVVEFVVYLLASSALIAISAILWRDIISSFGAQDIGSLFGASFAYMSSIGMFAALAVLIPILLFTQSRNSRLELQNPEIKNHRWRKGFLGFFLVVLAISAISSAIGLLQGIFSSIANIGLSTGDAQPVLWKSVAIQLFNVVLFAGVAAIYARDYRHSATNSQAELNGHKSLLNKGLAIVVTLLVVVFVIFPFQKQRNSYIDGVISEDVSTIISKLSSTRDPSIDSVDDLNVSDNIKKRAKKFDYTVKNKGNRRSLNYEVCATFKTDTTSKDEYDYDYPILQSLSESLDRGASVRSSSSNPNRHIKGKDCFSVRFGSYPQEYDNELNSGQDESEADVYTN